MSLVKQAVLSFIAVMMITSLPAISKAQRLSPGLSPLLGEAPLLTNPRRAWPDDWQLSRTTLIDDTSTVLIVQQDGEAAVDAETGIIFGGELPTPEPQLDNEVDAEQPQPAREPVDRDALPFEDASPSSKDVPGSVLEAPINHLASLINGLPVDLPQSADWAASVKRLEDYLTILNRDNSATNLDALRGVSRTARDLDRSLAAALRDGLRTDQFSAVRQARDVLTGELMIALQPLEEAAGIAPIAQAPLAPAGDDRVLARPPVGGGFDRGLQPYSAYRPSIPDRPIPNLDAPERYDWRDPLVTPGFEFRLDISPGFGAARYYPPATGYRYGYGPAYGLRPYNLGYRYHPVPFGASDFLYPGFVFPPAAAVLPYGPEVGLRFGVPIGPFGFGF